MEEEEQRSEERRGLSVARGSVGPGDVVRSGGGRRWRQRESSDSSLMENGFVFLFVLMKRVMKLWRRSVEVAEYRENKRKKMMKGVLLVGNQIRIGFLE
ncbi:hypothetical protein RJT34_08045 [Clitoria ternatea]|uniref:Uncharacterized protein n=1 Tax=Clitoria ternatea TaxID=43366 RepID=A0AAN9K6J0_CLITE